MAGGRQAAVALLLALVAPASAASTGPGAVPAAPGTGASPQQQRETPLPGVETSDLALRGVPFSLALDPPGGLSEALPFTVLEAGGRELASGRLAPADADASVEVTLEDGDAVPITVRFAGAGERRVSPTVLPGWISLLPPLLAIAFALIFREVVVSLFFGVWLGAFFWTGLDPVAALWRSIDRFAVPALADTSGGHPQIIIFSLLLGGMVGVMARCGGTKGIVEAVRPIATSPRRAQVATYLAGIAIFFDDYANTLIVGNTLRPITDAMKVSREKLAYIVDSTAAPVASVVFVSTWVGFEISLIAEGLRIAAEQPGVTPALAASLRDANAFTIFIESIPYRFYPLLAMVMVGLVIWTQRDFGPMWEAENRASRGDGLYRDDAMLMADTSGGAMEAKEGVAERWYNAAIPVITVILVVLGGLYFGGRASAPEGASLWTVFGEADPFDALLWGSLAGCIVAIGLAVGQRLLDVQEAVDAWLGGMRAMLLAAVILVLAWSLSEVTQVLGTASYLSGALEQGLPVFTLPVLVFATAAATAFATGTSWGTMAILLPIVIPLTVSLGGGAGFEGGGYTVLLGVISSVLAGAIFGDHCSPISDTTVMSSMASACDHVDHVRTQLPYALLVGVVGMAVGDVPTALGLSPWISYAVGAAILFLVLRFFGRPDHASPQWKA